MSDLERERRGVWEFNRAPPASRREAYTALLRSVVTYNTPEDYLSFGFVICSSAADVVADDELGRTLISGLRCNSLMLVDVKPIAGTYERLVTCLHLALTNCKLPALPLLPRDCRFSHLYEQGFDPEAPVPRALRNGYPVIDPHIAYRTLITRTHSAPEEQKVTELYYDKGTRWWIFSPTLLRMTTQQLGYADVNVMETIMRQFLLSRLAPYYAGLNGHLR